MSKWSETDEAAVFIGTAASRDTSPEIMKAIVHFARNNDEAVALWDGSGFKTVCRPAELWAHVTGDGQREATDYAWGAYGHDWWEHINKAHG